MAFNQSLLPLSLAPVDQDLQLVEIRDAEDVRQRLGGLGLTAGARVRVLRSSPGDPLIISVKNDSRLAIGFKTAHRILVTLEQ